jgi:hypothetical protein
MAKKVAAKKVSKTIVKAKVKVNAKEKEEKDFRTRHIGYSI